NAVNELLNVIDRNGFDGFKQIVEIYKRDHSPQKALLARSGSKVVNFQLRTKKGVKQTCLTP
ncbi:MAG: hypothetical protein ABRQ31_08360, partial [Smithellaceae bacterium]